jgi:hypothetical protein
MLYGKQEINLKDLIRRTWLTTEMRLKINELKVSQYALEMKHGALFPLPIVFHDSKSELYHVGDGFHRILAFRENKQKHVDCEVKRGDQLAAILCNIEANRTQRGLPFSTGDLQKCIETLLRDKVASQWTQSKIAETVGCSIAYTSWVVKKLGIVRPVEIIDRNGRVLPRQHVVKDLEQVAERRKEVINLYLQGMKKKDIQAELKIGRSTVQRDIEISMSGQVTSPHCNGTGVIQQ